MSAERFPVAVDSITIPGRIDAACKKSENFNVHINVICNNIYKFYGMEIVTHAPAQRPTRCSSRRRSIPNAAVHHQIEIVTFSAPARRRIVSAVWKVFLRNNFRYVRGRTKCWHRGYAMRLHMIWAVGRRSLMSLRPFMLVS